MSVTWCSYLPKGKTRRNMRRREKWSVYETWVLSFFLCYSILNCFREKYCQPFIMMLEIMRFFFFFAMSVFSASILFVYSVLFSAWIFYHLASQPSNLHPFLCHIFAASPKWNTLGLKQNFWPPKAQMQCSVCVIQQWL